MADISVAAATEQERVGGGADVDGDGFQESYDDDDERRRRRRRRRRSMTMATVAAGGWREQKGGREHRRPHQPAATDLRVERDRFTACCSMWMRDEYFRVERPFRDEFGECITQTLQRQHDETKSQEIEALESMYRTADFFFTLVQGLDHVGWTRP